MSTPVVTQILDEIGLRLGNISSTNGYLRSPEKVERARLTPLKNSDLPIIVYYSTSNDLVEHNFSIDTKSLLVTVESYDVNRDLNFEDVAQMLAVDIEIAVNRATDFPQVSDDPSTALGGLVQQVNIISSIPAIGNANATPYCGCVLNMEVVYKVQKLNPFVSVS